MIRIWDLLLISLLTFTFTWKQISAQNSQTNCTVKTNTSCEACLENVTCLWCIPTRQCMDYPVGTILPTHKTCPLNDARWGQCWVNFQSLIIALSVVGGVIIISLLICCFCCCKCENIGSRSDTRIQRESDLRRVKQEERKTEMRIRHDEIRQKYGLSKVNPYSRFENN
ncbi:PTTG1 interacting protein b [Trichomycterus rosablanca]|uniref:PTTG1 interacting protein b n=1 Tax=Trichomycterus rosablanca TaxID=2290929 RepID=UPI002F359B4F